jgi:hypothetical protein
MNSEAPKRVAMSTDNCGAESSILGTGQSIDTTSLGIHVDTDREIFPTKHQDTQDGILILRRWIEHYRQVTECRLPASLEHITPPPEDVFVVDSLDYFYRDGWGQLFIYRVLGSGYELISLGEDGRSNTPDDIVYRWPPPPDPIR